MSAQQEKFDKATELLKKLGVKWGVKSEYRGKVGEGREEYKLPILSTVHIHFTADEWCHMASSEGAEYIGGCCGQTSNAQDILCHIFRMSPHWIPISDLEELALSLHGHDGVLEFPEVSFEGLDIPIEEVVERIERGEPKWEELSCWSRLALVWHIVRDAYEPREPHGRSKNIQEDEDTVGSADLDYAVFVAQRMLQSFSFDRFFAKNKRTDSQSQASRTIRLYRLIPYLNTIHDKIGELYSGPLEGYALWDLENDEVASNGFGPCVFHTEDECNELIDQWERTAEEYEDGMNQKKKGVRDRLGIRKVRITKEKGLELI